jgi:tRNA nucleotidyltransferase/poly(A) polymerase
MKKQAIQIVETLKSNGYQAVFAGGYVRDLLLVVQSDDIDIATSALPEQYGRGIFR